jgi:hypothetical protein
MVRGSPDASQADGCRPKLFEEDSTLSPEGRPSPSQKSHSQPPIDMIMLRNAFAPDDRRPAPDAERNYCYDFSTSPAVF